MVAVTSSSFALFLLLVGVIGIAEGLGQYRYLDILNDKANNGVQSSEVQESQANSATLEADTVQELYFTQRLDHFDSLNLQTYQQRYFYTDRYVLPNPTRTVTFLCVGGEGPGFDKSVLVDSPHCSGDMLELAKRLSDSYDVSVHVYALEHRYYGKSYPKFQHGSAVTTENLKYLSSRQALEDLSHFVRTTMTNTQQESTPWVTFGGSYPGYMAGNARLKYPHLIFAAVSNSAPLDLKADFPGYNRRVGWDLQYEKVGGSQQCLDIVRLGHQQAVSLIQHDPIILAEKFDVCNPKVALSSQRNRELLLGDGLITVYAQGNDPSCDDSDICNIERLCQFMIASKSPAANKTELDVLAEVASKQRGSDNDCLIVDFEKMLDELSQPVVEPFGTRSWLWQTCTEVGFYQTCDETCPFANFYHLVDQDLEMCQVVYGIANVYDNVQATRDYYGGLDISTGSRVLSVNGDVDPWSVLGLHESSKYSLPVSMVEGASHHFWTHPVKPTDAPEIVKVREYIYSVVMEWLGIEEQNGSPRSGPQFSLRGEQTTS